MVVSEIILAIDNCFHWFCANTYFFTPGWCWIFLIVFLIFFVGLPVLGILSFIIGRLGKSETKYYDYCAQPAEDIRPGAGKQPDDMNPFEFACLFARMNWLEHKQRSRSVCYYSGCPSNFNEEYVIYGEPRTEWEWSLYNKRSESY